MGNKASQSRKVEPDIPRKGTCAYYMYDHYGVEAIKEVENWHLWTMGHAKQFPREGTFERSRLEKLGQKLQARKTQNLTVDWLAFYYCDAESRQREQQTKILNLELRLKRMHDTMQEINAQLPSNLGIKVTVVPSDPQLSPKTEQYRTFSCGPKENQRLDNRRNRCFNCGEMGHWRKQCPYINQGQFQKGNRGIGTKWVFQ